MKTFLIGLFSLALLASGAAWAKGKPVAHPGSQNPGNQDLPLQSNAAVFKVCQTTGIPKDRGAIVIEVRQNGDVKAWKCKGTTANPIKEQNSRDPGVDTLVKSGIIGHIQKYTDGTGDPCFEYTIDGISRVFCW